MPVKLTLNQVEAEQLHVENLDNYTQLGKQVLVRYSEVVSEACTIIMASSDSNQQVRLDVHLFVEPQCTF